jgi:CubicO group peptidase (beta-lactamase class C family)
MRDLKIFLLIVTLNFNGVFCMAQQSPSSLFCTKSLESINADIRNDKYGKISSLLIYEGSRLIYENYYGFSQPTTLHPISSVTKSITSIAVGICIDKGYIPSLDVKIIDYFPEFQDLFAKDTLKKVITLRHLLTQTSGFKWDEWDIHYSYAGNPLIDVSQSKTSWNKFVVSLPMDSEPGKKFSYNSLLSELIKEIITRSSGTDFKQFVVENIFKKLSITSYHWDTYPENGVPAWGGLSLSSRDMAKIGILILNEGVWNSTRVVSSEWVRLSTSPLIINKNLQYGLLWWVGSQPDEKSLIFAAGYGDQYVYILPDKGIVIAFNGQNFTAHKWDYNHEDLINNIIKAYLDQKKD